MDDLEKLYEEKIQEADKLIDSLQNLSSIKGISKLKKLIKAEKTFLVKAAASATKRSINLSTTNLMHFEALIYTILQVEKCDAVLEPFSFRGEESTKRIVVDIVRDEGKEWIKVTARNPKSLMMSCLGDTNYGSRTILDQAQDFIECASQNPVFYIPPKVTFKFSSGIDALLARKISNVGVEVVGDLFPSSYCSACSDDSEEDEVANLQSLLNEQSNNDSSRERSRKQILKLNLDITAIIAYVSDMTNGGTCMNFVQAPLTFQAQSEKTVKVKDALDKLFEGKELYCCETAMTRFNEIINVVGGEEERRRAQQFLKRVTVVPDCVSDRVMKLKEGGQIKTNPKIVFGTSDSIQAVTVSANWGFCRSAEHQGVHLATFLHEPRALSEQASILIKNSTLL